MSTFKILTGVLACLLAGNPALAAKGKPPVAPPAAAAAAAKTGDAAAQEYDACTTLAKTHPQEALVSANFWSGQGGGALAAHCKGLALMSLGQFEAASKSFSDLAADKNNKITDATRARLWAQAAQAALSGGQPAQAGKLLENSISLQPDAPGFRIDRSITFAMQGDYGGAVEDLNTILARDPGNVEALTLRGNAYRFLSRMADAEADIAQALLIQPDRTEALLERGAISAIGGNFARAWEDWQQILKIAPDSAAARAARDNLKQLEGM
jgi:tetratricopeptide (TPR) repeat protein